MSFVAPVVIVAVEGDPTTPRPCAEVVGGPLKNGSNSLRRGDLQLNAPTLPVGLGYLLHRQNVGRGRWIAHKRDGDGQWLIRTGFQSTGEYPTRSAERWPGSALAGAEGGEAPEPPRV